MNEIQELDSKASNFVRARAGWCCERCSKQFAPPTVFLQCAHFIIRSHKATRFYPDNLVALCVDCHKYFDGRGKKEFDSFMLRRLGASAYNVLLRLGRSTKKESEAITEARAWL